MSVLLQKCRGSAGRRVWGGIVLSTDLMALGNVCCMYREGVGKDSA